MPMLYFGPHFRSCSSIFGGCIPFSVRSIILTPKPFCTGVFLMWPKSLARQSPPQMYVARSIKEQIIGFFHTEGR